MHNRALLRFGIEQVAQCRNLNKCTAKMFYFVVTKHMNMENSYSIISSCSFNFQFEAFHMNLFWCTRNNLLTPCERPHIMAKYGFLSDVTVLQND